MGQTMKDPIMREAYNILIKYQFLGKKFLEGQCKLVSRFESDMPEIYSKELSLKIKNHNELNKLEMREIITSLDLIVVALPDNIEQTFPQEIQHITSLLRQRYARKYRESPYIK